MRILFSPQSLTLAPITARPLMASIALFPEWYSDDRSNHSCGIPLPV